MSLAVHRAADRFTTRTGGIVSRHAFSFGAHYDPANTGFGRLVACNEEELAPGAGFPEHPHAGLDIVTWVLEGAVAHEDSTGARAVLRPGAVQLLRTGPGVRHAEANAVSGRTRFLQLWLRTDEPGPAPSYEQHDLRQVLDGGGLVPVLRLDGGAELSVGRLSAGSSSPLPGAERVHLLVTRGTVAVGDVPMAVGDTVRLTAESAVLQAAEAAEVVVVTMHGE